MPKILTPQEILKLVPQQFPFRFLDEIVEVDNEHIVGKYQFRPDEFFYKGHFPGRPITPGVILIEAMAQTGVVAWGIYMLAQEVEEEDFDKYLTIFSDGQAEFFLPVLPGDVIFCHAEKVFWRKKKLRCKVEAKNAEGKVVASCIVSGMGVPK